MNSLRLQDRARGLGALSAALALLLLSGCGNFNRARNGVATGSSYNTVDFGDPTANGGFPGLADYSCGPKNNVLPASGSGESPEYLACSHKNNTTDAAFVAPQGLGALDEGPAMPRLCFFPIDVISATTRYFKYDPQGYPLYQCVDYAVDGMKVGFAYTKYNAAVIVPEKDRQKMSDCMLLGRGDLCPAYSTGKFRN